MGDDVVRLGVIGAGAWGRQIIAAASRLGGMSLTRVASSNPETSDRVGPGCTVQAEWREVAAAENVDAVAVATLPHLHAEMASAALAAGKAVLVEKPLTLDLAEAEALLQRAEGAARPVLVNHIHLFSPAWRALKDRALAMGPAQFIRAAGGNRGPFRADIPPLWDYAPHDIAMCLDLLGERPVSVAVEIEDRAETAEGLGEVFQLRLTFADGVAAAIRGGNLMDRKRRLFAVHFDGATMIYDDLAPDKLVVEPVIDDLCCTHRTSESVPLEPGMPLDNALLALAAAVRADSVDLSSLRLGVDVISVLQQCQDALGEH